MFLLPSSGSRLRQTCGKEKPKHPSRATGLCCHRYFPLALRSNCLLHFSGGLLILSVYLYDETLLYCYNPCRSSLCFSAVAPVWPLHPFDRCTHSFDRYTYSTVKHIRPLHPFNRCTHLTVTLVWPLHLFDHYTHSTVTPIRPLHSFYLHPFDRLVALTVSHFWQLHRFLLSCRINLL